MEDVGSRCEFAAGQAYVDAEGRRWSVYSAMREGTGGAALRVQMTFREASKRGATFIMQPTDFQALVRMAKMRPL